MARTARWTSTRKGRRLMQAVQSCAPSWTGAVPESMRGKAKRDDDLDAMEGGRGTPSRRRSEHRGGGSAEKKHRERSARHGDGAESVVVFRDDSAPVLAAVREVATALSRASRVEKGRRSSRSVRAFERLDVIIAAALVESSSLRFAFFIYALVKLATADRAKRLGRVSATRTSARAEPGRRVLFGRGTRWWPSRGRRRRGPVSRPRARDVTTRRAGEDPRLRRRRLVRVDAERPRTKTRLPRGLSKIPRRRAHLPRRARPRFEPRVPRERGRVTRLGTLLPDALGRRLDRRRWP